jgi:branched-subunit amino acid ABC-type transport system permease component
MLQANVIFPAFSTPYFLHLLFPIAGIAAILAEVFVFRRRYQTFTIFGALSPVLVANVISWIFGIVLSLILPSGLVPKIVKSGDQEVSILSRGPDFGVLVAAAFGVAFVLSIVIEYPVWKFLTRKDPLPNLLRTTCIAHVASYSVLILITLIGGLIMR